MLGRGEFSVEIKHTLITIFSGLDPRAGISNFPAYAIEAGPIDVFIDYAVESSSAVPFLSFLSVVKGRVACRISIEHVMDIGIDIDEAIDKISDPRSEESDLEELAR